MALFRPVSAGFAAVLAIGSLAYAGQDVSSSQSGSTGTQTATTAKPPAGQTQKPPAKPEEKKPDEKKPDEQVTRKEDVVVSASKTEQQLVDAPATMTVINSQTLAMSPSANYADILRNVPGTNVSQISARDINVNQRGATSSLATGQLTVVDGRSVYLDFFGFTMWEFVPNDLDQIKQIEVIRGPASAVWGANALTGVVSFITKTPREMAGESVTFGAGTFNTDRQSQRRGQRHDVLRARHLRPGGQRSLVLQGQRRLLQHRPARAAGRPDSERWHDQLSRVHERGHPAAAIRRARRLRLRRRRQQARDGGRLRHDERHDEQRPRPVPDRPGREARLLAGDLLAQGPQAADVHEHPGRHGAERRVSRSDWSADRPDVCPEDVRRRVWRHAAARHAQRADLRRQRPPQPLRAVDCAG